MSAMIESRPCIVCGQRTLVPVSDEQLRRYKAGEHVQDVWPDMMPSMREILITGTHPACWDLLFAEEEDEDDPTE